MGQPEVSGIFRRGFSHFTLYYNLPLLDALNVLLSCSTQRLSITVMKKMVDYNWLYGVFLYQGIKKMIFCVEPSRVDLTSKKL